MHPANIKNSEMILGILTLKFQTLKAYAFPLALITIIISLKKFQTKV